MIVILMSDIQIQIIIKFGTSNSVNKYFKAGKENSQINTFHID